MMGPPPVQGILQTRAIAQLTAHTTAYILAKDFWIWPLPSVATR
jgi:hypothetical protein